MKQLSNTNQGPGNRSTLVFFTDSLDLSISHRVVRASLPHFVIPQLFCSLSLSAPMGCMNIIHAHINKLNCPKAC